MDSLEGWHQSGISPVTNKPPWIGILGGEPTMYPQFEELCYEIQKRYPRRAFGEVGAVGLWTTGNTPQYYKYEKLINETMGFVIRNPHDDHQQQVCEHQPIATAIDELVDDMEMRKFLIAHCWVQRQWCPTINHFGAYFCEVAGAQDILLNKGLRAWPVVKDWWKRIPDENGVYGAQSDACNKCGMAVPMERDKLKTEITKFTPKMLETFRQMGLKGSAEPDVAVVDKKITNEEILAKFKRWYPGNYHGDFFPDEVSMLPDTDLGIHPEDHAELIRIGRKLPKMVDGQVEVKDTEW